MLKLAWRVLSCLIGKKEEDPGRSPAVTISYVLFFEARLRSPKLLPDDIKRCTKDIPDVTPKARLFQVNCRTAYSDVREWRKNTFPETEKAFLSSPPGVAKISR